MRNKVRIDNFLNNVDISNLINDIWKLSNVDVQRIIDNISDIKEKWYEMPDMRFSQILVYLSYINNESGFWYYYEEDEILKIQGYKPRDYVYWGNIFDKNGNKLPEVNYILIKDMNLDHMQTLIKHDWIRKGSDIYKVIESEILIRTRKEKLKKIGKVL